jgi:hypothetical protein
MTPAPLAPPLRPLTLGEVLDVSFGLYRAMFFTLFVVGATVHLIPILIQTWLQASGRMFVLDFATLGYWLISVLMNSFGVAATTSIVSEAYLGRRIGAGDAILRALPLIWPLMVVSLLSSLLVGIGLMLLFVPGLILLSGLLLASVAMVVERPPKATAAMARSWELTRGHKGQVFGTVIVAFLLLLIPRIAVLTIWTFAGGSEASLLPGILSAIVEVMVYPYLYTVITVLYYDLRIRKEGFDLDLMAAGESA